MAPPQAPLPWGGDTSLHILLDAFGISSPIQNSWLRHCVPLIIANEQIIERHSHPLEYNIFP